MSRYQAVREFDSSRAEDTDRRSLVLVIGGDLERKDGLLQWLKEQRLRTIAVPSTRDASHALWDLN